MLTSLLSPIFAGKLLTRGRSVTFTRKLMEVLSTKSEYKHEFTLSLEYFAVGDGAVFCIGFRFLRIIHFLTHLFYISDGCARSASR